MTGPSEQQLAPMTARVEEVVMADGTLGVIVHPRRRHGENSTRPPVVLTDEKIQSLMDNRLSKAAAHLGIPPTALKCACRKLGLEWSPSQRDHHHRDHQDGSDISATAPSRATLRQIAPEPQPETELHDFFSDIFGPSGASGSWNLHESWFLQDPLLPSLKA
eukprot:CAMPEP_0177722504 /NCGR_PEP_ID=MMETSP0484_2-20121128/17714_1 /TAXON_ID=354590 /ORGANISM="Rhodomonas lens, Strain RHODO" /LENGTH=161 /DNA_ID=CAMNT_0019234877 /DNA_START=93 /DNA_END=578 /DNA_ORIENTATION=+